MVLNVEVCKGLGVPTCQLDMEMVERKGKGHPDVICDRAAEELSVALSKYYLEKTGRILHHNVDKCVLVGGQSNAVFGGGEVIEPIYLLLVGRAALNLPKGERVPIGKLVVKTTRDWLSENFRFLDPTTDIIIDYRIKPGSVDLVETFELGVDVPRANDTSFGVAFAPLTETEKLVYMAEKTLNSPEVKKAHPEIGEDIKVMGVRRKDRIDITVACAIISRLTPDPDHYLSVKETIKDIAYMLASKITEKDVEVYVNTADDPANNVYYLTVTGTSAEHGDDGQVGRGNRANGLITPYRPMTLEATAGKNPVSHVGKTYNIAARKIVEKLINEEESVEQASCYIVSRIGKPINEPQAINIEVYTDSPLNVIKTTAENIASEVMEEMPRIWKGFIEKQYELF
ncbi:MAG: methionine adenosyltransferase [Candidatus Jordarchaeales archaeon]